MKPTALLPALLILSGFASADTERPVREVLRDALYAEEVTRAPEAAARQYEEVVSRHQAEREIAATALFRLAEVRRKQDRKDDAIKLYQQLLTEFPAAANQAALAKENLAALGGSIPSEASIPDDPEARELGRILKIERESPDQLDAPREFTDAIESGHAGIIRHFIEKGFDPNAVLPTHRYTNGSRRSTALVVAAADGNLSICELLLQSGARADGKGFSNPLPDAVYHGRAAIVDLFLKHGADPEDLSLALEDPEAPFVGGALAIAIERGHPNIAGRLLEAGVNVNLAHPKTGLTPLHFALVKGQIEFAMKLVDKGADPDAESIPVTRDRSDREPPSTSGPQNPLLPLRETPLLLAVNSGSIPLMESILPRSRQPDLAKLLLRAAERDLPVMVKWLLQKGADPSGLGQYQSQILFRAVKSGNLETVKVLLEAGANPLASTLGMDFDPKDLERVFAGLPPQRSYKPTVMSPLRAAVVLSERSLEMTRLLIEGGAKPDDRWLKSMAGESPDGLQTPDPAEISQAVGALLIEKFVIPKLNGKQAVHLLFATPPLSPPITLTGEKSETLPPGLPQLLLDTRKIDWPTFRFSEFSGPNYPVRIEVWRTRGGTASVAWKGRLDQKEDFPPLFWGDVVRLGFEPGITDHVARHSPKADLSDQLPSEILWNLRRKISFPVKIRMGGSTTDYQICGGLVVFDPTRAELPLTGIGPIAALLSPLTQFGVANCGITINRRDWPDISINPSEPGGYQFALMPDDVIRFETPDEEKLLKRRKAGVTIVAKDLHARRYFPDLSDTNGNKTAMPTLFQAVTDILAAPTLPSSDDPKVDEAVEWFHRLPVPATVWLNPDFSGIRIRRLKPDDSEEIIPIDLAAAIAASSDTSTFAEIRALDHQLQTGDIVEIPLLGDPDKQWSGLTGKEESFFAKALNGRIQVKDRQGAIILRELRYRALRYADTPSGKLPLPKQGPGTWTSTFTPLAALGTGDMVKVRRGGEKFNDYGTTIFLRHGDDVEITNLVNDRQR